MAGHSWHPVPFLLSSAFAREGAALHFTEQDCLKGSLGIFPAVDVMPLAMAHAGRLSEIRSLSMRRPFIAGNWKMNTDRAEASRLASALSRQGRSPACRYRALPAVPYLDAVQRGRRAARAVAVGAQDVYWEPKGAFTGEVSVAMLGDFCRYAIIGHSERRQFFGETDEWVNRKLAALLASPIDPIVCVGELLAERRAGDTEAVLARQLRDGLAGVTLTSRVTIAYEPVWAIGTGETATPEVAQEACAFIRGRAPRPRWRCGAMTSASSTAAASTRRTPRRSCRSRISMARSWAARRSKPTSSWPSSRPPAPA